MNALESPTPPLVSIGLPVRNGEHYLEAAIDSILSQDLADLELIIGDNASSDRTAAICEAYAARDPRVRYRRNARDLGAGPNYDLCFHRARGTFFKWAAHDDCLAPGYLRKTVAALQAAPDAVLCTTGTAEIDAQGAVLRRYVNRFPGIGSADPAQRLGAVIHTRHQCEDFFGLFRRQALLGSGLHDIYSGSDRVLLAEMAIRGRWVTVEEPLFLHREHAGRYTRAVLLKDRLQAQLWQDTTGAARRRRSTQFHLTVYRKYLEVVRRNLPPGPVRLACYGELARWWLTDGHAADVLRDALADYPTVRQALRAAKHRLVGAGQEPVPGSLPDLS
ncbi:MAG TPA: glycosyltransferase family 2 protein [Crenalkalicoccus sp.]|nr:glycosyltransferase family 2 protein [Crenalkalicoccus sp.]